MILLFIDTYCNGMFESMKQLLLCHFLLKYLYQGRKVSCHLHVLLGGINVAPVSAILLLYFGTFLTVWNFCFPFYYAICITISYVTTIPILHDCYLDVSAVSLLPWYELSTGVAPVWCWKTFLSFWTILASSSPLIINNTYELVKCRIKINDMIYSYK